MEKASKWIRNYLMGRKEEKYKIGTSSIENKIAESPKVKRRWSFGRKTNGKIVGNVAMHRFSRSFDSSESAAKLQKQSVVETHQCPQSLSTTMVVIPNRIESAAATKIQAAFRSYLARKALHALRGLVKIQALVRGHLVRKQTSATMRGIHALMAIQVRARIHRIQTAEAANLLRKHSPQHREITRDKSLLRELKSVIRPLSLQDSKDMSLREMLEVVESRSGPLDSSDRENGAITDSKRRHQYKGTALTREASSRNNLSICERRSVSWEPNYLTKTESSRAKARSLSEPKQRPKRGTKHRNKSTESTKELIISSDGRRQSLSSNSSRYVNHGSMDHWVMNHYESMMDGRSDSFNSSMANSDSYY